MAITTLAGLKTAVARWLNRSDLADRISEFIELADARVRREQQWDKRIHSVETGGALSIIEQGQALPAGVQVVLDAWPQGGTVLRPLAQTSFAVLQQLAHTNGGATGEPQKYAILPAPDASTSGARIFLWPEPSGDYQIDFLYIHDVGKLASPENRLFLYAPDVYMWAALAESAPFLKHDERTGLWESKYQAALASLNALAGRAQFGASQTHARLRQAF